MSLSETSVTVTHQQATDTDTVPSLLRRAVSGVLRNAQNGDLPLFTWTLGLPQSELLHLLRSLFPEIEPVAPMAEKQYQRLLDMCPSDFCAMRNMLQQYRDPEQSERQATWLAHAITCACYGEHDLWQELDLGQQNDLSHLLHQYFPALYSRLSQSQDWKKALLHVFYSADPGPLRH
ncbi:MAG: nitrogen fixation protein NifQ [Lautropia sp.]|nr:nitrogen fixation protein NifQ [Lautropia sp.]